MKKILMLLVPVIAFVGGAFGGDILGGKGADAASKDAAHGEAAPADDGHSVAPADAHAAPADDHAAPEDDHAAPADDEHGAPADDGHGAAKDDGQGGASANASTFFRFPTQFFVPIVRNGGTQSIMIMTVTLETKPGAMSKVEAQEHRLRDSLLRSLLIQANTGGFDGNFTTDDTQSRLREALLKAARDVAGEDVAAVLIEDIARKEG